MSVFASIGSLPIGQSGRVGVVDTETLSSFFERELPLTTIMVVSARRIVDRQQVQGQFSIGSGPIGWQAGTSPGVKASFKTLFSDAEWCGRPDDFGWAHVEADPRLTGQGTISEVTPYGIVQSSRGALQNGEWVLSNADGYFDDWLSAFSPVGLTTSVYLVDRHQGKLSDGILIAQFEVQNMVADNDVCRIVPNATVNRLSAPLTTITWQGTGGLGGDAELEGVIQEQTYGFCTHVPVQFYDRGRLAFSFHTGKIEDFILYEAALPTIIWDGVDHPDEASFYASVNDPQPGYYTKCTALGKGRLGREPQGVLTADVWGAHIFDRYSDKTGEICYYFTTRVLTSKEIQRGTFLSLPDYEIGVHLGRGQEFTVSDLLDALLRPFAASYRDDEQNRVIIVRPLPPGDAEIQWSIDEQSEFDVSVSAVNGQVFSTVELTYARYWRPLGAAEIADVDTTELTVDEARELGRAERRVAYTDQRTRAQFGSRLPTISIRSYFVRREDALTQARQLQRYHRGPLQRRESRVPIEIGFRARAGTAGIAQGRQMAGGSWTLSPGDRTVSVGGFRFAPVLNDAVNQ